jgi:uncharacterized BrkB/YihY/UPF0761 family membrane protein
VSARTAIHGGQAGLRRAVARLEQAPASQHTLGALERDRRLGGGLLAGALAFRLFALMLPLALLVAVGLGYAATLDRAAPGKAGEAVGLGEAALDSIAQSSKLSTSGRWLVGAFALFALLYAGLGAAKAVHAAHCLAWDGAVKKIARPLAAAGALIAVVIALAVVWGLVGLVRADVGSGGLVVAIAAVIPFIGIWLTASQLLPHGSAPWTALLPGAVLVGVGLELIHVGSVLFIADKVARASATYGPLGTAFTFLVWLFLISRVIVASAMLNAALWERRRPAAPQPG